LNNSSGDSGKKRLVTPMPQFIRKKSGTTFEGKTTQPSEDKL
jgi:hypothetical protein